MRLALLTLLLGGSAWAASPTVGLILPRGGQRGTDVTLTFQGANLADAQEIIVYYPGIAIKKIESATANEVKASATIAADCRLGEHAFRVRTATGISDLRTFWVGALPIVEEKEPNNDFANPQAIGLNVTVHGIITSEDVDFFVVDCKKGQRLSVEIEGMRLGNGFFDPCVTIYNDRQFELAVADDSYLTGQDGGASIAIPADGKYIIQVRETSFGGNRNFYRLHIGNFPRPTAVIPAGGKPGETVEARFLGDPLGEIKQKITFSSSDPVLARVHVQSPEGIHPAGIKVRINDLPNLVETANANNLKSAIAITSPIAVHGVIGAAGEMDHCKFTAKKGQALEATVYARRLGSALDPVIGIYAIKKDGALGNGVIGADDVGGPDPFVRFSIPEDGEYAILIRDHLNNGGPSFFYRIELQPPQPGANVRLTRADNNNSLNQDRQTWSVPKGGRLAVPLLLRRNDWGGPGTIALENLPPGVTATFDPVDFSTNVVPVILEAKADTANAFRFVSPRLVPKDRELKASDRSNVDVVLATGQNNSTYHVLPTDRVAVAVTEAAPFSLEVVEPKVPIVQNGSMQLKVVAKRAEGFTGPIRIIPVLSPPNVGINYSNQIPENATECFIPISAAPNAAARKWRLAFMAVGNAGGGNFWVGSQLFTLEVSPPLVTLAQQRTAVEQGQSTRVVCKVTANVPFAGKAKATLVGLPPKVIAAPVEFEHSQPEITFNVTTDKTSPAGKHNCFVQVMVVKDGESILHNAGGGEFRIDVPLPPKAGATAQAPPKPAAAPPKPLTRLEQLRKEQEEREKKEAKPSAKSP